MNIQDENSRGKFGAVDVLNAVGKLALIGSYDHLQETAKPRGECAKLMALFDD